MTIEEIPFAGTEKHLHCKISSGAFTYTVVVNMVAIHEVLLMSNSAKPL